ncbi:MAG: 16S rRNA (cytidine(1402)-2'-O)-methyltransferase [Candidatus Paceibacterota bacterium]
MFYIVGTAIGNIKDTTLRAVQTLVSVDVILAEDTRSFNRYYKNIQKLFCVKPARKQKIISYYMEIELSRLPEALAYLNSDLDVALVSESGLPIISDPGSVLVKYLTSTNKAFTVIPGPTAFATAVVLSGLSFHDLLYMGYLPKKPAKRIQRFKKLQAHASSMHKLGVVFYESPHRINKTLEIIDEVLPNAQLAICREMTKKFEDVVRGSASELMNRVFKGEITVVMNLDA